MSRKNILRIIFTLIVVILGLVLVVQSVAKSKLSNALNNQLPSHIHLDYEGLTVNVLSGSVRLSEIKLGLHAPDSLLAHTEIEMKALNLEGLGYTNLLFHNCISVQDLELIKPKIKHFPNRLASRTNSSPSEGQTLGQTIEVANFKIVEGDYHQMLQDPDSTQLEVAAFDLSITRLVVNRETLNSKIPFSYDRLDFRSNGLYADLGPFEVLQVATMELTGKDLVLKNISLNSKYNKSELSRKLRKERDHIKLEIPETKLSNVEFGFNSARFYLDIDQGVLNGPNLEMYRDKLVPDDMAPKKLYSRMLREMPLDLNIEKFKIQKGYISYAEKVTEQVIPGEIIFTNLNADLKRISNVNKNGEGTKIEITSLLMNTAPLELNWSFDPQMENDAFLVSGRLYNFNTESINPFLTSNLRAEANGEINELFFTFSGDAVSSTGDMKMKYQDFKFKILQKDRKGVNKILTAIGNIFTNDGSRTDDNGYRYGTIYTKRDSSKSFFNYLWLNVKEGILSTLTGNGKKE